MNAPGTPQPPKPSLKLKVPGATTGGPKLGGGPKPAVPAAPPPPPSLPGALPSVAAPPAVPGALPSPTPVAPPPVAMPALSVPGAAPAPPVPGSAPTPAAPGAGPAVPPPSVPSPMAAEGDPGQQNEDSGGKDTKPPKGKKKKVKGPAEPKAKAKPSLFFLVVDFLIFGGAVALSILVFLKS